MRACMRAYVRFFVKRTASDLGTAQQCSAKSSVHSSAPLDTQVLRARSQHCNGLCYAPVSAASGPELSRFRLVEARQVLGRLLAARPRNVLQRLEPLHNAALRAASVTHAVGRGRMPRNSNTRTAKPARPSATQMQRGRSFTFTSPDETPTPNRMGRVRWKCRWGGVGCTWGGVV